MWEEWTSDVKDRSKEITNTNKREKTDWKIINRASGTYKTITKLTIRHNPKNSRSWAYPKRINPRKSPIRYNKITKN